MDARAREAAFAEAWQFRVEFLRKILTDLEDGSLDLIIIVQQPLGRRTGMWFGLTCGEPCLGQPPFHRIQAGPGHERSRAADKDGELVEGRRVGCRPAEWIRVDMKSGGEGKGGFERGG